MAFCGPVLVCYTIRVIHFVNVVLVMVVYRFLFTIRKPKRASVFVIYIFVKCFCLETEQFGKLRLNFQGQTKIIQVLFHAFF